MKRAKAIRWTRDELLVVLNFYHKLKFGHMDEKQPVVIDLAKRMRRTPGSVAMKLCNLASLDPALKLRGIRGLPGSSLLDRKMWEEYHTNAAEMIPLAQEKFDQLFIDDRNEITEVLPDKGIRVLKRPSSGGAETTTQTKRRIGQDYFRDVVLNNYNNSCAITGLPVRDLLVASHILPWSEDVAERLNIRNGISLNRLHDSAFDQYLISFDDELCLILSPKLKSFLPSESVNYQFEAFEGKPLSLPSDGIPPDLSFISRHRNKLARK
jgi:putative restriction endonuclease